jgi:hypothetical protein
MYEEDEKRELIQFEEEEEIHFYQYCFCLKSLYEIRECRCKYCVAVSCMAIPATIVDAVILVPQILINNVKLCLK